MFNTCHHPTIAILVATWKILMCTPPFLESNLSLKSTLNCLDYSTRPTEDRVKFFCLQHVFFLKYSHFQSTSSLIPLGFCRYYICSKATQQALTLHVGSRMFQLIKAILSKEGRWFRELLKRWNMDLLFLTGTTTKGGLVPREVGLLRSAQCPLLYFCTCCTLKSHLFV